MFKSHAKNPSMAVIQQKFCQVCQNDSRLWNDSMGLGLHNLGLITLLGAKFKSGIEILEAQYLIWRYSLPSNSIRGEKKSCKCLIFYTKIMSTWVKEFVYMYMFVYMYIYIYIQYKYICTFLHITHTHWRKMDLKISHICGAGILLQA